MNAPLDIRMDKAAFLRWAEGREGRWELIGGKPRMQDTGSLDHSDVAMALYDVLRPRLARNAWKISVGQFSVEIGEEVRVADVLVAPASVPRKALATDQAVLLAEVLSPSSKGPDLNSKRTLYQSLPSLEVYVVASQDEAKLWLWQRSSDLARTFPDDPVVIADRAACLDLACLAISFTLDDVYSHIFPG